MVVFKISVQNIWVSTILSLSQSAFEQAGDVIDYGDYDWLLTNDSHAPHSHVISLFAIRSETVVEGKALWDSF